MEDPSTPNPLDFRREGKAPTAGGRSKLDLNLSGASIPKLFLSSDYWEFRELRKMNII